MIQKLNTLINVNAKLDLENFNNKGYCNSIHFPFSQEIRSWDLGIYSTLLITLLSFLDVNMSETYGVDLIIYDQLTFIY